MSAVRVRHLRLEGLQRTYDVSFLDEAGAVRPISFIAGEISTGKTSILEFIAYCLGAKEYPQHPEVQRSVRAALVEVELNGVRFVIERTCVERASTVATVHSCPLDGLDESHTSVQLKISPPSDPASLSTFLLASFGLSDVDLREAPTQPSSGTDRLSIRDLLRLVLVRYQNLGGENLLLEHQPQVRLKHEQVIDLLFNAHDNRTASLASQIKDLERDIETRQGELNTITAFLTEQRVPTPEVLQEQLDTLDAERAESQSVLREIESQMSAVAEFGNQQRTAHVAATQRANAAANDRRTAATQIERLTALAAQYDQDVKKLTFAREASVMFDPLMISVCPWCFQAVTPTAGDDSDCSLCHQPLEVGADTADTGFDISKELRAVKQRAKELAGLLDELHSAADEANRTYDDAVAEATASQVALDQAMQARFAPYIDQRDSLVASLAASAQDADQVRRLMRMHDGAQRRSEELGSLRQRLVDLTADQANAETTHHTRVEAAEALSDRFAAILAAFKFPKLAEAHVDGRYVPHVRGQVYNRLGSTGARTLVSLAWYLALFELTTEQDGPHPGLLMIDSPQKGLLAQQDQPADEDEQESFRDASIAESVYRHLLDWASTAGGSAQIIVVDNLPQPMAEPFVAVRYTGQADAPPYGLIDDAVE